MYSDDNRLLHAKKLTYNGVTSTDMGLVIQAPPVYNLAERDVSTTHIPGRNGDVIIDNGCYKNTTREYSLAKVYTGSVKTTVGNGQELFEWLTSAKGKYVRLEDDYDPDVYRKATLTNGGSLTDILDKALVFSAQFNCKPQRFLKIGEVPITYLQGSTEVIINNQTHYEAKPLIKIENLPTGTSYETLVSVKDAGGDEVSLMTVKDIEDGEDVYIDSENESCYDATKDINDKLALNGKNLPILKKGNTTVSVEQYEREDFINIDSYDSIIHDQQTVCETAYSPKETTIASFEDKYNIKSYNALIASKELKFNANAYQSRLIELCDQGIIDGFDTNSGKAIDVATTTVIESFTTSLETSGIAMDFPNETYNNYHDIFAGSAIATYCDCNEDGTSGNYKIVVKSTAYIYAVETPKNIFSNAYIKRYGPNEVIFRSSSFGANDIYQTVTFYIAVYSDPNDIHMQVRDEIQSNLPIWLKIAIAEDSQNRPIRAEYVVDLTGFGDDEDDQQKKYVWHDKIGLTGLFGKAGWKKVINNEVVATYAWNALKRGFTVSGSLLSSVEAAIMLRFVDGLKHNLLQYNFGQNVTPWFTVQIDDNDNDLTKIVIYSVRNGYYRFKYDSNERANDWVELSTQSSITDPVKVNSTKSFTVEYLASIPDYSSELEWPSWLDPIPIGGGSSSIMLLNQTSIYFKVREKTYYRTYTVNDDGEEIPGNFMEKNVNDPVSTPILVNNSLIVGHYYSEAWPIPAEVPLFKDDRYFKINNTAPGLNTQPSWVRYEINMKVRFNDYPNEEVVVEHIDILATFDYPEEIGSYLIEHPDIPVGSHFKTLHGNFEARDKRAIYEKLTSTGSTGAILLYEPDDTELDNAIDNGLLWKATENVGSEINPRIFMVHDYWAPNTNDKIYKLDSGAEWGSVSEEPTIYYYAKIEADKTNFGFYKYDNVREWTKGDQFPDNLILKTNFRDTTIFYYIYEMPAYDSELPWADYLRVDVQPHNANPSQVLFIVKDDCDGYYKANSLINWKYYKAGEVVLTSLPSETNTITKLNPVSDSSLEEVTITITPNWWML